MPLAGGAVNSTGCQLHAKLLRFGNALRTQRGTWSFAPGALPAMTTARLAQPAERKALNLVVVGSSPTVGAFEFLREAIVGAFAGGYVLLCAQARRGRGGAAALARQLVARLPAGRQQRRTEAHGIEAGCVYGCLRFADCGCLV